MGHRTATVIRGFDPDELLGVVAGATTEHYLPKPSRCTGVVEHWSHEGVSVDRGHYEFEVGVRGVFRPGSICIGRAAGARTLNEVNGIPIARDDIQMYPEGAEFFYRAGPGARWTAIQARPEAIQAAAVEMLGHPIDVAHHAVSNLALPAAARTCLVDATNRVMRGFESGSGEEQDALADVILHAIVEALDVARCDDSFREHQIRAHRRLTAVREAQDFLKSRRRLAYDSAALCGAIRLPERTIQVYFRRTVGMSPKTWFTSLRLHDARQTLMAASTARDSVTGIASRHGFTHLGRFAAAYRKLFAESPSSTLLRARGGRPRGGEDGGARPPSVNGKPRLRADA